MSHERCIRPDGNKGCIDCVAYGAMEEQSRIIKLLEEIYYDFGEISPIGQWAMRKAMNAIDPGGFISPRSEIKGEKENK